MRQSSRPSGVDPLPCQIEAFMLQSIRKGSKSWLGIALAGFMMILFGLWGFEDMLATGIRGTDKVIKVAGRDVTGQEFQNRYRRAIDQLEREQKRRIDYQTAKAMGVVDQIIQTYVSESLYAAVADSFGLRLSPDVLREEIVSSEQFRGQSGTFDRQVFITLLQRAGFSEQEYVAAMEGILSRQMLLGGITASGTIPESLKMRLFEHRGEKRVASVAVLDAGQIETVPEPTREQLEAFYDENKAKYRRAEFRTVTALIVTPEKLFSKVTASNEEIEAAYERRRAEFTTPERRGIQHVRFKDKETAETALGVLREGRTFESVAEKYTEQPPVDLGTVEKEDIGIRELREVAFALDKDGYSAPVQSPFGWHIARVTEIIPRVEKPIEEVRETLEDEIRKRRAVPLLAKIREDVDDSLGGGVKLETIAERLELELTRIPAIDRRGQDAKGEKVEGLPEDGDFVGRAFTQKPGGFLEIHEVRNDGFFVVRVDEIRESHVPPIEEIEDQVRKDWTVAEREALAQKRAEALAKEIEGGKDFEEAAKAAGFEVRTTRALERGTLDQFELEPDSLQVRVFRASVNETMAAKMPGGWGVAKVTEIQKADLEKDEKELREIREAFTKSYRREVERSFDRYLRTRYEVEVNESGIDSLFRRGR